MAVHKVPQDVEAEDHFLGPLTFKQFLFGGAAAICGYIFFLTISRGLWPVALIFAIPTVAFVVLAIPWSKDQPTDVWLAARIRFYLVPHKRIWNQDGMKELVTVTVPVRERKVYSDGLSQSEVRNRFGALASMVDSRGWAVKGGVSSTSFAAQDDDSDRLAAGTVVADPVKSGDSDDPLDDENSVIARQFDNMIHQAGLDTPRQAQPTQSTQPANPQSEEFWFLQQQQQQQNQAALNPNMATFNQQASVAPGQQPVVESAIFDTDTASQELLDRLHAQEDREAMQGHVQHERVILPAGQQPAPTQAEPPAPEPPVPPQVNRLENTPDPAILPPENSSDVRAQAEPQQDYSALDDNGEVIIDLH